jgi:hypothetical protein
MVRQFRRRNSLNDSSYMSAGKNTYRVKEREPFIPVFGNFWQPKLVTRRVQQKMETRKYDVNLPTSAISRRTRGVNRTGRLQSPVQFRPGVNRCEASRWDLSQEITVRSDCISF